MEEMNKKSKYSAPPWAQDKITELDHSECISEHHKHKSHIIQLTCEIKWQMKRYLNSLLTHLNYLNSLLTHLN
jgi:hypothetical protein